MQNPGLANILLKCTENKQIVESTTDRFWGTGIPLANVDCLDNRKWISPGLLGEILEEIHAKLSIMDTPANAQAPKHPNPSGDNSMDTTSADRVIGPVFSPTWTKCRNKPTPPTPPTPNSDYRQK